MTRPRSAIPGIRSPSDAWVAATTGRAGEVVAHHVGEHACPAASSAEVGSSNSQIGRRTATSRAIDSLRRCPADRYAAGKCAACRASQLKALPGVQNLAADKIVPERQVLQHAECGFQRVAMTR